MQSVVHNSAYVPPEWILAHGLRPWRLSPAAPRYAAASYDGCCAWAQAFADHAAGLDDVAAIVTVTTCDQMRRAAERLMGDHRRPQPRVISFNLPATWQTPAAQRLYRDELRRLGRWLERCGGIAPSPDRLKEVMIGCQQQRRDLLATLDDLTGRQRAAALGQLHGDPTPDESIGAASIDRRATPVALVGSAIPRYQWWVYDAIEQCGGRVALDATDYGERGLPASFDARLMNEDPFEALAAAYFDGITHVRQRPNTGLYQWLAAQLRVRPVRGLIVRRCLWCDLWHAEIPRLKQWSQLPVLELDLDETDAHQRALSRISAFMEMLA